MKREGDERRELRELERQRTAILDNIPDMAWLKDSQHRFITVNRRWLDVYGARSVEEVVGTTDYDHCPKELADRYRADDEQVFRTRQPRRVEEVVIDTTGAVSWIETIKT